MGNNLTNQYISASFEQLVQVSSSAAGEQLTDGTGSLLQYIDVQVSSAISSSYAVTASYAENGGGGGSADTGSLLVTASIVDATTTYVKGDGSSFPLTVNNVANATSALLAVSASHAVNADSASSISNFDFQGGDEFQVLRTNGAGVLEWDYADRTQSEIRTTEAVTKGDPLYVVGFNSGQNRIEVGKADASDPAKMPVFGLAYETVASNQNSQMVAIGSLNDVNTQVAPNDFQAGDTLYVKAGGGLTNVRPSGTDLVQNVGVVGRRNQNNGEILVSAIGRSNDLPNLPQGSVFVGGVNDVAEAVNTGSLLGNIFAGSNTYTGNNKFTGTTTFSGSILSNTDINAASFSGDGSGVTGVVSASHAIDADNLGGAPASTYARTDQNNTFVGTQTFDNIAVNGTGSFAYIQSVTGSAKVIGDAFIILNNDTPTERYAGIIVQDSGSGAPLTTSSFQYDGQTDDWFYEYSQDGGTTVDHGVALFGPEYNTKGSPVYPTNNAILKGDGGHHVVDSNITDDGTMITINGLSTFTSSSTMAGVVSQTAPVADLPPALRQTVLVDYPNMPGNIGREYLEHVSTNGTDDIIGIKRSTFTLNGGNLSPFNPGTGTFQSNTSLGLNSYASGSGVGYVSTVDISNTTGQTRISLIANQVWGTAYDTYEIDGVNGMKIGNYAGGGGTFGNIDIGHNAGANVTIQGNFATNESADLFGYENMVHGKLTTRKLVSQTAEKTEGDITGNAYTASIDTDSGNTYILNLPAAANTHIEVNGQEPGQSCQMVLNNSGNSTVTFPTQFKFQGGVAPTLTNTSGSTDVISFSRLSWDYDTVLAASALGF